MIQFDYHADSLSISKDASTLAVGLSNLEGNIWDGGVKVISVETGVELASAHLRCGTNVVKFVSHENHANSTTASSILAGRDDGLISFFEMSDSSSLTELARFDGHDDIVASIALMSSTSKFYSCGWEGNIILWDPLSGSPCTAPLHLIRNAHFGHVNDITCSGSSSECLLASGGDDGFLRLWDSRQSSTAGAACSQLLPVKQPISCLYWDERHAHRIFAGTDSGKICGFDLRQLGDTHHNSDDTLSSSGQDESTQSFRHTKRVRRIISSESHSDLLFSVSDDGSIGVSSIRCDGVYSVASSLVEKDR
jgi:WD40 repeat protein